MRGQWKGSWEAYGGGGGATSVEFGVRGEDWEWGDYGLDKVRLHFEIQIPLTASHLTHLALRRLQIGSGLGVHGLENLGAISFIVPVMVFHNTTGCQNQVVAEGAYHSEEGIKLHEFLLSAGVCPCQNPL